MAKSITRIKEEIIGVVSVLVSLYLGLSLVSYSRWDPSFFTYTKAPAQNYGGVIGAHVSDLFMAFLGLSCFLIPVFLLAYGIRRLMGMEKSRIYLIGALLLIFSASLMTSLLFRTFSGTGGNSPGGMIGTGVSNLLRDYLSVLGAYIVSLSLFFSSIILLIPVALSPSLLKRRKTFRTEGRKPEQGIIQEELFVEDPAEAQGMHEPVIAEPVRIAGTGEEPVPARRPVPKADGKAAYLLPSVELLTAYDTSAAKPSREEILQNSEQLRAKLADFDVEGTITNVEPGPVVTLYKFEPAPGIKINKVVSLSDDLALALKAQSLRISPVSGENTIGIEVPNKKREVVSLREIINSDAYRKSQSKLTLALGKDIAGRPVVADLTKMPHLLVAGATGAGKSVSINSMVMSMLFKAAPGEVKMLMIDPKLIELSLYEDIPHLISPVITNPKQAAEALRKMVFEMERRYRVLAERGARNIESFNRAVSDEERMPFIVIFIDELADLMFASSREVEDSITRLAQMARAAGIHLIIGTQRPSVDVITGIIKANLPTRISFKVTSRIDSRTILDTQGAEQLLDKGDMLLMSGSSIRRVHGTLVTEEEIKAVSDFIKAQGSPDYSIFEEIPAEPPSPDEDDAAERDEMYYKAMEFAESAGEVSISSLQRRFKIGYNRAARIMEMMEDDGLVGPPKGAGKPRDFLRRHH
jgi:S-DNA-T family DNA segregation ATPase FtsK/SpoIIIE